MWQLIRVQTVYYVSIQIKSFKNMLFFFVSFSYQRSSVFSLSTFVCFSFVYQFFLTLHLFFINFCFFSTVVYFFFTTFSVLFLSATFVRLYSRPWWEATGQWWPPGGRGGSALDGLHWGLRQHPAGLRHGRNGAVDEKEADLVSVADSDTFHSTKSSQGGSCPYSLSTALQGGQGGQAVSSPYSLPLCLFSISSSFVFLPF